MDNTTQSRKEKPDLKTGLIGLSMFGAGLIGLIPAVIGLMIVGGIAWVGLRFMIGFFGIIFS